MGLTTTACLCVCVCVSACLQPAANKAVFTASPKSERLGCERMSQRMEGGGAGGGWGAGGAEELRCERIGGWGDEGLNLVLCIHECKNKTCLIFTLTSLPVGSCGYFKSDSESPDFTGDITHTSLVSLHAKLAKLTWADRCSHVTQRRGHSSGAGEEEREGLTGSEAAPHWESRGGGSEQTIASPLRVRFIFTLLHKLCFCSAAELPGNFHQKTPQGSVCRRKSLIPEG